MAYMSVCLNAISLFMFGNFISSNNAEMCGLDSGCKYGCCGDASTRCCSSTDTFKESFLEFASHTGAKVIFGLAGAVVVLVITYAIVRACMRRLSGQTRTYGNQCAQKTYAEAGPVKNRRNYSGAGESIDGEDSYPMQPKGTCPDQCPPNPPSQYPPYPPPLEPTCPPLQYPQKGPPSQYPQKGPPSQYPPNPPSQYPQKVPPSQYPQKGPPSQYPPNPPSQYPQKGPPSQYPQKGPPSQYPPNPPSQYTQKGPPSDMAPSSSYHHQHDPVSHKPFFPPSEYRPPECPPSCPPPDYPDCPPPPYSPCAPTNDNNEHVLPTKNTW